MPMPSSRLTKLIAAAGLGIALLWGYWPVLATEVERWTTDPKYSHGYFVPLFSAWLLWSRFRRRAGAVAANPWVGSWWGLLPVLVGVGLHTCGEYYFIDWLSELAFLPALAGLCWCIGGWRLLRLAGPSIGFLAFMLPLPYRIEVALANPLQRLATVASTYLLQTLGVTAFSEGNIIVLNHGVIGVVEACSGLGMLVTFFALATAVAIVLKRPLLDRILVVASAVPIAVLANIIRITATGILFETLGDRVALVVYHDLAGWLMMPLALVLIGGGLLILSRLLVEPPAEAPAHEIGLNLGRPTAALPKSPQKDKAIGV